MKPEMADVSGEGSEKSEDGIELFLTDSRRAEATPLPLTTEVFNSDPVDLKLTQREELINALAYVFELDPRDRTWLDPMIPSDSLVQYSEVEKFLEMKLKTFKTDNSRSTVITDDELLKEGKIGPATVHIQRKSTHGEIKFDPSNLSLTSMSNFCSVRANACVFKGKWMYEVILGTAGIQQLGWATLSCPFTNEEGVGDAPDSYAIDGKRVRKWNGGSQTYGQPWVPGDVIGCLIDLNEGTISFARNGVNLGVAFAGVRRLQPGLGYFPALSLSHGERCDLNFGGRPFVYPVEGYLPLQAPPVVNPEKMEDLNPDWKERSCIVLQANFLLNSLKRICKLAIEGSETREIKEGREGFVALGHENEVFLSNAICAFLGPILVAGSYFRCSRFSKKEEVRVFNGYIIWSSMVPFLLELHKTKPPHCVPILHLFFDLLFMGLSRSEVLEVIPTLLDSLSYFCRIANFNPVEEYTASYPYLSLVCQLVRVKRVVRIWYESRRFAQGLENFLTRKPPNKFDLEAIFPNVWWMHCREKGFSEENMVNSLTTCCSAVSHVEDMQTNLCKFLLNYEYSELTPIGATRSKTGGLLVNFIHNLLQKNKGANRKVPPPGTSDNSVLVSLFFVLLRLLTNGEFEDPQNPRKGYLFRREKRRFPVNWFLKPDSFYVSLPRIGGLYSHVSKNSPLSSELIAEELTWFDEWGEDVQGGANSGNHNEGSTVSEERSGVTIDSGNEGISGGNKHERRRNEEENEGTSGEVTSVESTDQDPGDSATRKLELELMEALILLYHLGPSYGFKQSSLLVQTAYQSVAQLDLLDRQLELNNEREEEVVLRDTRENVLSEVLLNIRLCNWARVCMFSRWKQDGIFSACGWVVKLLLATSAKGDLLSYVPEFYVETLVDALHALKRSDSNIPLAAEKWSLSSLVSFLVIHFNDPRVVSPDVKDTLLQALSMLLQHREYIRAFEANKDARERLPVALFSTFDRKYWIPITQVLVRLCKGTPFGEDSYRITRGRDCPSAVFKSLLRDQLKANPKLLDSFLNQLFNTLNFTLTQLYIGVKDLEDSTRRSHHATEITSKKCDVMFELSCNLLRVVELLSEHVPWGFTKGSEFNLMRLCELVLFILSRTSGGQDSKLFHISMSGRGSQGERLTKESILCPIVGIFANLGEFGEKSDESQNEEVDVAKILANLDSAQKFSTDIESLLKIDWIGTFEADPSIKGLLKFKNFVNRLSKEVSRVMTLAALGPIEDEEEASVDLCPICCARNVDTTLLPCKHQSCKKCVKRHLVEHKRCFFCKTLIQELSNKTPEMALLGAVDNEVVVYEKKKT